MHVSPDDPTTDSIDVPEPEVRAALKKILESAEFAKAKRVGEFLRFATEEVLAGRGDRLKAFSIAREVYGRDETFDPRSDTIVRVEAGRLRQRLAAYYESEGRRDPVRIEIPKGGYNPTFKWNEEVTDLPLVPKPQSVPESTPRTFRNPRYVIGGLVLAIVAILAGWALLERSEEAPPNAPGVVHKGQSRASTALLAILPLVTRSNDPSEDRLAAGLVEAIITDLTKLSGLSVMAHASLLDLDPGVVNLSAIASRFGATHVLRGSLERSGDLIRVNVQLIDIATNATIWADRLDSEVSEPLALQDTLADRVVTYLAVDVSPDECTLLERHHTNSPEALALYRQAFILIMPPNDKERIVTARHMFQRVVDMDPTFAGGYAGVSFSHAITVLFLKTERSHPELEKAIGLALKAVEVDSQFGMGYATLALAYALSGRTDEALFNAGKAITLQPGDAFAQFVYGLCLTLSGKPAEAVSPLSEAIRLDPGEPRTPYRNVLGIAYYATGEYETAAELFDENLRIGGPAGPHMATFRAATYAALGKDNEAQSIIQELVLMHPEYPVEHWLAKWLRNADDLSMTMDQLYRHGLPKRQN
jgi:adenylate cyclase